MPSPLTASLSFFFNQLHIQTLPRDSKTRRELRHRCGHSCEYKSPETSSGSFVQNAPHCSLQCHSIRNCQEIRRNHLLWLCQMKVNSFKRVNSHCLSLAYVTGVKNVFGGQKFTYPHHQMYCQWLFFHDRHLCAACQDNRKQCYTQ